MEAYGLRAARTDIPRTSEINKTVSPLKHLFYPANAGNNKYWREGLRLVYFFGLQVHFEEGLPQPEQTLFFIGLPHFMHGLQPQLWHIA